MNLRYRRRIKASVFVLSVGLVSCGGGSGWTDGTDAPPPGPAQACGAVESPLVVQLQFAQTHVLPPQGLSWTLTGAEAALHLVGGREALVLVTPDCSDLTDPFIEGLQGTQSLGRLRLAPPVELPTTESGGPRYSNAAWSATVPPAWMLPGVSFVVGAAGRVSSLAQAPTVGADSPMNLRVLPFYLFGATDINTQPFAMTRAPDAATQAELFAKWPVAQLHVANHGARRVDWSHLVIPPEADENGVKQPAHLMTNLAWDRQFSAMDVLHSILTKLRAANGDVGTNNQYYAPILGLDPTGRQTSLGGVGANGVGVGDAAYTGVFIHEQGHAYGLPHAGEAYAVGKYPYPGGSLLGSAWGYAANVREFLSPLVPSSASSYLRCRTDGKHQRDSSGRCYKQDPMQGGAGDQSPSYKFASFSDYNTAKMQEWFEGKTTRNADGSKHYAGGVLFEDPASATGYSRWDGIENARVPARTDLTLESGVSGIRGGFALQRDVPVYAIVVTRSSAGAPAATQIYPPLAFRGNLLKDFDPTDPGDQIDFRVDSGKYAWYCKSLGCDYTLRVTYSDGSKLYRVLKGAFRPWFQPLAAPAADTVEPLSPSSFMTWAINVPGDKGIASIELLDTPAVWQHGLPTHPVVLAAR